MSISNTQIRQAIDVLEKGLGVHLNSYRASLFEKFMQEHICEQDCDSTVYLQRLASELGLQHGLFKKLMIHSSWFFRDRIVFDWLGDVALPDILVRKRSIESRELRIWSAGCGRGEETYSLAMVIKECLETNHDECRPFILGTDVETGVLEDARDGKYTRERMGCITLDQLQQYFLSAGKDSYRIVDELKQFVTFSRDDLLDLSTDNPEESLFGGFDVILCRNLLIYYTAKHQYKILEKVCGALSLDGYLVLGRYEELPKPLKGRFEEFKQIPGVYRRME